MSSSGYEDDEKQLFLCLFCPHPSPSLPTFHSHLDSVHSFALPPLLHSLTFYQRIRLVNFCRARTKDGFGVADVIEGIAGDEWREDEALLQPVLADDAVLINLNDDDGDDDEEDEALGGEEDEEEEEEWDDEDDEEDAEDEDIESTVRQRQPLAQHAAAESNAQTAQPLTRTARPTV